MTLIEFRRKDGDRLYCFLETISAWTRATGEENRDRTDIWIGNKLFTLGETVEEVTAKLKA